MLQILLRAVASVPRERVFTRGLCRGCGINNIFDKDPPLATSEITAGGANNTHEIYDTPGRPLFVWFTAKF